MISSIRSDRKDKRPALKGVALNHARNRIIIENVHAFLKRFKILRYICRHEVPKQAEIITATCLLANRQLKARPLRSISQESDGDYPMVDFDEFEDDDALGTDFDDSDESGLE